MLDRGSSTTSWRTSGSSCTSDGPSPISGGAPSTSRPAARLAGLVRLSHPFPSVLNALVTGAIAFEAGGAGEHAVGPAVRLALAMLALQVSIGAVNDLVDADVDRGRKPGKPIPRGLVGRRAAFELALAGLVFGLGLSAWQGIGVALVATLGVGLGYLYDVRLSRTPWSWLPLAVALPLLPVYAWLGATGSVPAALWLLVPVGGLAGLGLALGNGLADYDRDEAAGVITAALRLGRVPAWRLHAAALGVVVLVAIALAPRVATSGGAQLIGSIVGLKGGSILLLTGVVLAGPVGPSRAAIRERGWELEAIGVALVGLAWLLGIANPSG